MSDEPIDVLRELVELKDGPRDADYERRKPQVWALARATVAAHDGRQAENEAGMEAKLRRAGWRQSTRDGRWRHDDFGGAFTTENAYAKQVVAGGSFEEEEREVRSAARSSFTSPGSVAWKATQAGPGGVLKEDHLQAKGAPMVAHRREDGLMEAVPEGYTDAPDTDAVKRVGGTTRPAVEPDTHWQREGRPDTYVLLRIEEREGLGEMAVLRRVGGEGESLSRVAVASLRFGDAGWRPA